MSDCINWSKSLGHNGYGLTTRNNKTYRAHRLAYCDYHGIDHSDIKGMVVRHTCDNRKCINPEHLVIGTHQDNMDDMKKRNRTAKGEAHGRAKLSEVDIKTIRDRYIRGSKEHGSTAIAKDFGVAFQTVSKIINRHRWQSVQ